MIKYIIKNCPEFLNYYCKQDDIGLCQDITDCVLKRIVELCREQKTVKYNIDGKEQILKAYLHTYTGDKILKLLEIEECENE